MFVLLFFYFASYFYCPIFKVLFGCVFCVIFHSITFIWIFIHFEHRTNELLLFLSFFLLGFIRSIHFHKLNRKRNCSLFIFIGCVFQLRKAWWKFLSASCGRQFSKSLRKKLLWTNTLLTNFRVSFAFALFLNFFWWIKISI